MSDIFQNSRTAEILETAKAIQEKTPDAKTLPLETRALTVLAFKAKLIKECGKAGVACLEQLNLTLAICDPELMIENRALYKRMEAAFLADLQDLRKPRTE